MHYGGENQQEEHFNIAQYISYFNDFFQFSMNKSYKNN